MRAFLLTLASIAAAGAANATSVENIASGKDADSSIATFTCSHCPPPVVKKPSYIVPQVAPGTERVELKEINGEMKLVRTEAWLGGSPVVFVNKASDEAIKAAQVDAAPAAIVGKTAAAGSLPVQAEATATVAIIDTASKTGALDHASMGALTPEDSSSQEVDLQNFELRLK